MGMHKPCGFVLLRGIGLAGVRHSKHHIAPFFTLDDLAWNVSDHLRPERIRFWRYCVPGQAHRRRWKEEADDFGNSGCEREPGPVTEIKISV